MTKPTRWVVGTMISLGLLLVVALGAVGLSAAGVIGGPPRGVLDARLYQLDPISGAISNEPGFWLRMRDRCNAKTYYAHDSAGRYCISSFGEPLKYDLDMPPAEIHLRIVGGALRLPAGSASTIREAAKQIPADAGALGQLVLLVYDDAPIGAVGVNQLDSDDEVRIKPWTALRGLPPIAWDATHPGRL